MKPNSELKQTPGPSIRTVVLILLLIAISFLGFLVRSEGQTVYEVKPVIKEKVDTVKMCDATAYMFKDGAAWVEEKNSFSYYSKKYFDKWMKKHKKCRLTRAAKFS